MRPDEFRYEFEIDPTPIWPDEDDQLEPVFLSGPMWIDFEELDPLDETLGQESAPGASAEPMFIGFEEAEQLDLEPAADVPDRPPQAPRQRAATASLFGSLGVHLLTLLVLIGWNTAPAEISGGIPVQLVLEQAAPAPDPVPPGEAIAESVGELAKDASAPPPAPPPPPTTKVAAAEPPKPAPTPPQPKPPPTPIRAPTPAPAPAPPVTHAVLATAAAAAAVPPLVASPRIIQTAAAAPPKVAAAIATTSALAPTAIPVSPAAPAAASATGHGDYLNQLVTLTRGHLNILPLSFLAGRRGRTTLSVLVIEDGTIGRISVKRSSGYPDIDARIEQMVTAVGRFPPVPASLQHPAVELDFDMSFPDALQQ